MKADFSLAKAYSSELENKILNLHPIYSFPKPVLHSEDETLPHPYTNPYSDLSTPATGTPPREELSSPLILPSTSAQDPVTRNAETTTSSIALAQHLKPTPGSPSPPPSNSVETKSRSTPKAPQQVKFHLDNLDHNHANCGSPRHCKRPRGWYRWNRRLKHNTHYHVPASILHLEESTKLARKAVSVGFLGELMDIGAQRSCVGLTHAKEYCQAAGIDFKLTPSRQCFRFGEGKA